MEESGETRWIEMAPWFPRYWVSGEGRVYSNRLGREISLIDCSGYFYVRALGANGARRNLRVNRIVCWHFNGPYPNDGAEYIAAHLDCDPYNNHYWNLEWQTYEQNQNHPITLVRHSEAYAATASKRLAATRARWEHRYCVFRKDKLIAYRKARGISQYMLGILAGVDQKSVSNWETGQFVPTGKNIQLLANALGIEVADLLDLKPARNRGLP